MPTLPPRSGWAARRALRRYRRPLAGLCAAAAAWAALAALAPPAAPTVAVAVAARDLDAGVRLTAADVTGSVLPADAVPDGVTPPAAGSVLAGPVRRGEPFTDVRLVGSPRGRPAGTVALSVRVADPAAALAVRPGDRIDLLAGPADDLGLDLDVGPAVGPTAGSGVEPVSALGRDLLVLDVPGAAGTAGSGAADGGSRLLGDAVGGVDASGVLVLAVDRTVAARVAAAAGRPLTVAVVGP